MSKKETLGTAKTHATTREALEAALHTTKKKLVNTEKELEDYKQLSDQERVKLPKDRAEQLEEAVQEALKEVDEAQEKLEAYDIKIKHAAKLGVKGDVFLLVVDDKRAWLRSVDRTIMSYVESMAEGNKVRSMELLLDSLWLEGDEEIRNDDDYFMGAMRYLQNTIEIKRGDLKKF